MMGKASFMRARRIPISAFVLAFAIGAASFADDNPDFGQAIDRHSDAIVTIKFVMKMQMGMMGEQESESEIPGVMVGEKGLVLCANSQLLGPMAIMRRFLPAGLDVSAEPTDIKVIIGADDAEYEAKIIVRDKDLDLAWVQIDNEDGKTFKSVTLPKEKPLNLGDKVICVKRMGKFFNRTSVVRPGRVCGVTQMPRTLYIVNTDVSTALGLPVFTPSGDMAGLVVMQMPDEDEAGASGGPMGMMGSMSSMMEMFSGVVMPVKQIARATQRVRDTYVNTEASGGS